MRVCETCKGTYESSDSKGIRYYHECPNVTFIAGTRAGVNQLIPLENLLPTDVYPVRRGGVIVRVTSLQLIEGDERVSESSRQRVGHRNENVRL